MDSKLGTIRIIETRRFRIEIAEYVEFAHPADVIAYGDDPESQAAEREYFRKIEMGILPWYCLGVHVYVKGGRRPLEIGSAYLGCVDTYDLHSVGLRDVVHMAIEEARDTLEQLAKLSA